MKGVVTVSVCLEEGRACLPYCYIYNAKPAESLMYEL